jgi:hypothetical protein
MENGWGFRLHATYDETIRLTLTGRGRWSLDDALGIMPWPVWIAVAAVVIGPASALLTRLALHRPSKTPEGARYASWLCCCSRRGQ